MEPVRNMHKISLESVKKNEISMEFVRNIYGICKQHVWNPYGICM